MYLPIYVMCLNNAADTHSNGFQNKRTIVLVGDVVSVSLVLLMPFAFVALTVPLFKHAFPTTSEA